MTNKLRDEAEAKKVARRIADCRRISDEHGDRIFQDVFEALLAFKGEDDDLMSKTLIIRKGEMRKEELLEYQAMQLKSAELEARIKELEKGQKS